MDDLMVKLVEDVTETRTLVKTLVDRMEEEREERTIRQEAVDKRFVAIETKLDTAFTTWKTLKWAGGTIITILLGVVTFDWHAVATNWDKLVK